VIPTGSAAVCRHGAANLFLEQQDLTVVFRIVRLGLDRRAKSVSRRIH
jgi:hypothetical protein